MKKELSIETLAVHGTYKRDETGATNPPIYLSNAYQFQNAEHAANLFDLSTAGYIYSRLNNPTVAVLEETVAALEGGIAALACASGQFAEFMTIVTLAKPGDNVVTSTLLYGGTHTLFTSQFARLGIEFRFANPANIEEFEKQIDDKTKAIYLEAVANPQGFVPDFEKWFRTIAEGMTGGKRENPRYHIHIEPGRSIVAQCGSLITRVLFVKNGIDKTFLITDAGMNDLIRPALYGASHRIVNLTAESDHEGDTAVYDVVGPVCESSDVWAEGISLPAAMRGDVLAILSAGAYGQVMASRYNLRDLAPAVWLDWNGDEAVLSF